jgi:hypothetical protein
MQTKILTVSFLSALICLGLPAQTADVIPLSAEPHHHLAFHNVYVNVYQVEVSPHDSVALHRHDADAISVMLSDSDVTVRGPGKPDNRLKLSKGQVRLQSSGYVHSTTIESEQPYRNVTVELVLAQQGHKNLCAMVAPAKPLNCSSEQDSNSSYRVEPQFQTDHTRVTIYRLLPNQKMSLSPMERPQLFIAMDEGIRAAGEDKSMNAGDFIWLDKADRAQEFTNQTDREVALISFSFSPQ